MTTLIIFDREIGSSLLGSLKNLERVVKSIVVESEILDVCLRESDR